MGSNQSGHSNRGSSIRGGKVFSRALTPEKEKNTEIVEKQRQGDYGVDGSVYVSFEYQCKRRSSFNERSFRVSEDFSSDLSYHSISLPGEDLPLGLGPKGGRQSSSFSCLSGAALSANMTLANSFLCSSASHHALIPEIGSPNTFRRISSPPVRKSHSASSPPRGGSTCIPTSARHNQQLHGSLSSSDASSLIGSLLSRKGSFLSASGESSSAPDSLGSFLQAEDVQVAGGAAGEDRVQALCSEDNGWLFCGIYDGFSGRDAADFLAARLYDNIGSQLRAIERQAEQARSRQHAQQQLSRCQLSPDDGHQQQEGIDHRGTKRSILGRRRAGGGVEVLSPPEAEPSLTACRSDTSILDASDEAEEDALASLDTVSASLEEVGDLGGEVGPSADHPTLSSDHPISSHAEPPPSPSEEFASSVAGCMERALATTEKEFFWKVEAEMEDRPDLAMMGSCVLALLIHGRHLVAMNLGDSRAVLATWQQQQEGEEKEHEVGCDSVSQVPSVAGCSSSKRCCSGAAGCSGPPAARCNAAAGLGNAIAITSMGHAATDGGEAGSISSCTRPERKAGRREVRLTAVSLSKPHCIDLAEEREWLISQHPGELEVDLVERRRVKGKLRLTRAFGAGYLKRRDFNDGLMGIFQVRDLESPPYISSSPFLSTHLLSSRDRFVVLGSDGLFDFFTPQELVDHVWSFLAEHPHGDPAKHLLQALLVRAAKQAGLSLEALQSIPIGQRRKYHDDVTVLVIALEGTLRTSSASTLL